MRSFVKLLVRLLVAVIAIPVVWAVVIGLLPRRYFYKDRRPTKFGRMTNQIVALWSRYGGPPSWSVQLETCGPRSGTPNRVPIVIGAHDGKEYAVSMLGPRSRWVRNLRGGDGRATIRHGRARPVRLIEVTDRAECALATKAYLQRAIGARPHIAIDRNAPLEDFQRAAADYPVFRIVDATPVASAEAAVI